MIWRGFSGVNVAGLGGHALFNHSSERRVASVSLLSSALQRCPAPAPPLIPIEIDLEK